MLFGIPSIMASRKGAYDSDAQAFFTAAGITNETQKNAVNIFVLAAKSHGYWSSLTQIFPFVGGTSSTHAYNLKNATSTLTFGGGTHAGTGWNGNGSYGADTGVNHNTINQSAFTGVVYSRTDVTELGVLFGADNVTDYMDLIPKYFDGIVTAFYATVPKYPEGRFAIVTAYNTAAMWSITLGASLLETAYRNTTSIGTRTNTTATLSSANIFLSSNGGGRFSTKEIAFAAFSTTTGLTSTQITDLYNDVQAMETTLSRNV